MPILKLTHGIVRSRNLPRKFKLLATNPGFWQCLQNSLRVLCQAGSHAGVGSPLLMASLAWQNGFRQVCRVTRCLRCTIRHVLCYKSCLHSYHFPVWMWSPELNVALVGNSVRIHLREKLFSAFLKIFLVFSSYLSFHSISTLSLYFYSAALTLSDFGIPSSHPCLIIPWLPVLYTCELN